MKLSQLALTKADFSALVKGLAITMIAAGLTYLSETIAKMDFGQNTLLIVTLFSLIVNVIRKVFDGVMPKIVIVKEEEKKV